AARRNLPPRCGARTTVGSCACSDPWGNEANLGGMASATFVLILRSAPPERVPATRPGVRVSRRMRTAVMLRDASWRPNRVDHAWSRSRRDSPQHEGVSPELLSQRQLVARFPDRAVGMRDDDPYLPLRRALERGRRNIPQHRIGPGAFLRRADRRPARRRIALADLEPRGFEGVGVGRAADADRLIAAFLHHLDPVDAREQEIVLGRLERRARVDDAVAGILVDAGRADVARGALDDVHHLA